jgi:hypothetical protein
MNSRPCKGASEASSDYSECSVRTPCKHKLVSTPEVVGPMHKRRWRQKFCTHFLRCLLLFPKKIVGSLPTHANTNMKMVWPNRCYSSVEQQRCSDRTSAERLRKNRRLTIPLQTETLLFPGILCFALRLNSCKVVAALESFLSGHFRFSLAMASGPVPKHFTIHIMI